MNIIIRQSGTTETLSIIDPSTGCDYVYDFIGIHGALSDGQFVWDADQDAYICDQYTYDWWDAVLNANQHLNNRIHDLRQEHGTDAVYAAIAQADSTDLESHAGAINDALDAAFGAE